VANEVAFEYGAWGAVTKSMQNHEDEAGSTDPNVTYTYENWAGEGVEAKYLRQASVTYPGPSTPNRRVVYYNYPASGIGAALGRLDNIASVQNTTTDSQKFAAYGYLGAGTVVKVAYPAVTVSSNPLALTYWTSGGGYAGFDRLGRVIEQKWSAGSAVDHFTYGKKKKGEKRGQEPFPGKKGSGTFSGPPRRASR
jgi:hypothetical protein